MDSGWLTLFCLALVVLAALGGLVGLVQRLLRRRRLGAVRQWADLNGWAYAASPRTDWGSRLPGAKANGVLVQLSTVVDGRPVAVGEYSYRDTTSEGRTGSVGPHTEHYVVAAVRLRDQYPSLAVRRKEPGNSLLRALGFGGPVLGYEPFDRRFLLEAADPGQIHRWITPPVVTEHLAGRAPQWVLRGSELVVYWDGKLTDPEGIPAAAASAVRMAQLLRLT
jgi:hypothetical protein